MLKYKIYVKILLLMLTGIFGGAYIYIYIYAKSYPIPIFNRVSLDTKLMFLRDIKDKESIDTIIIGSSIGLNNVQGIVLEESSIKVKHALNISAFSMVTLQIEQFLEIISLFPNVSRIIYSVQFPDFALPLVFENYNIDFIKSYINLDKESIDITYSFYAYKYFIQCLKYHHEWQDLMLNNRYTYLGFDRTGSAPLHVYGNNISKKRWSIPHSSSPIKESYLALERMIKKAKKEGIEFYLVIQPYRAALVKKSEHVRSTLISFDQDAKKIVLDNGGKLLNLHKQLHLSDDFFADRTHLNDKGSAITSKAIGQFIDKNE